MTYCPWQLMVSLQNLSAHKTLQTKCCWPDDRFWGLCDYITQRHTLSLLRHHSDSLLQRQRFVQKLLRETLWLDRQNCFFWCSQTVPTQTHSPPNVSFVEAAFKRSDVFWKCEKYTEVQWTLTHWNKSSRLSVNQVLDIRSTTFPHSGNFQNQ